MKNYKNKIQSGLRWLLFDILHATTNQIHMGATEKGWDRTRGWVLPLGEYNSIVLGGIELGGKKTKIKSMSLLINLFLGRFT
jgi:hypothetical protein